MPENIRARVARTGGPSGGSLLHLVRDGASESMCARFPIEKLGHAGGFDDTICPECLDALTHASRSRQRHIKPN